MPLMMDNDVEMDIDDLFGDGNTLSLPARPPPKELFQRVDELRGSGCCQFVPLIELNRPLLKEFRGISWSKWGSIASISPSGFGLDFRNLRCNPRDGNWDLAGPTSLAQITPSLDGGPLQHIMWSPNGSDLAVIDAVGRITILTIAISLNRPNIHRSGHLDPVDDVHTVAGAYWLNLMPVRQQPPYLHRRATKTDEGWRYDMTQGISFGPCHPNPQKSALVCITTNGLLRLVYPQADGKWLETLLEIESIVSSDELITHASICGDKHSTLLIAFATTTKQLRVVRVLIKWGNKPTDKPVNSNQILVSPTMAVKHVAVTNWMDTADGQDPFHFHSSMTALSSLYILPSAPDGPTKNADLPVILTVRHKLPSSTAQYNRDMHTIIDRWEVRDTAQTVHAAFEQLSSRRNSTASQPGRATFLKKIDGLTIGKIALSVDSIVFDRMLVFSYSDGSVEYRNRWSLAELYVEGSIDQFSHLSQTGFVIIDDEPCLQIAISPTSCSSVRLGTNGKMRWKGLTYQMGQITAETEQSQYSAIVAGMGMTLSSAILTNANQDDLLAIGKKNVIAPNFLFDWLTETCRILKFSVDFSEESHHDNLVRNPSIQLCLSIQNSWGYHGEPAAREFAAKFAWIGLQTRNCVVLMTMATSMKVPVDASQTKKISGFEDAESIRMLTGSIEWCLDLMSYIIDALLHPVPGNLLKNIASADASAFNIDDLMTALQPDGNIALHLVLCSGTRGYLTAICRRLANLDYIARKAMAAAAAQSSAAQAGQPQTEHISNSLRNSYTAIATLTASAVVQIRVFEQFLTGIATAVKEAYSATGLSSTPAPGQPPNMTNAGHEQKNKVEQTMLFGGPLPAELQGAIQQIFSTLLPELKTMIDPSLLFFHDFSILALSPDANANHHSVHSPPQNSKSKHALRSHQIDAFLRTPLGRYPHAVDDAQKGVVSGAAASGSREKKFRRCARCGAVMEDLNSRRAAVSFLIMQQRRCFCGGNWVVLSGDEVGF